MDTQNAAYDSNETDLFELLSQFLQKWRWWLSGLLLGGLLGAGATMVMPLQYEATGIIKLGQVVQVDAPPALLEQASGAIARMQSLAFRGEVVDRLVKDNLVAEEKREEWIKKLDAKSFIKPIRSADTLVELTINVPNQEFGKALINTVNITLAERQRPLLDESVAAANRSLTQTKEALAEMEKRYSLTQASLQRHANSTPESYLELARMSEAGTYASLRQRVINLENALLPPSTKPSELLEPASVSGKSVSPKSGLFLMLGVLLGGALGAFLGFAVPAWRRFQENRKQHHA